MTFLSFICLYWVVIFIVNDMRSSSQVNFFFACNSWFWCIFEKDWVFFFSCLLNFSSMLFPCNWFWQFSWLECLFEFTVLSLSWILVGFRLRAAHHVNDRSSLYSVSPSSVVKASLKGQAETVELLSAEDDDHGGVIIEMKVPVDAGAFVSSLRASLENWRQQVVF